MTPNQAAALLDAELRPYPWYIATGVGEMDDGPTLFVYAKTGRHRKLTSIERNGWQGYKVNIEVTGPMRPILLHSVSKPRERPSDPSSPDYHETASGGRAGTDDRSRI
jgi:hypothetical protein